MEPVTVLDAKGGVEPQTETVWRQADKYGVPRMVYVNKMDSIGADFFMCINMLKERLHCNAVPIQVPIGAEDKFIGLVDLITNKAVVYKDDLGKEIEEIKIPDDLKEIVAEQRNNMLEAVADLDEELMMKYLEGEEITTDEIYATMRRGVIDNKIVPVFCGASYKNKGVQQMLDNVIAFMPSPLDIPAIKGNSPEDDSEDERHADDNAPMSAFGIQDCNRSIYRKACIYKNLLRNNEQRYLRIEFNKG